MDSLQEQASAAEESGNLALAFELWAKLAEADTDGVPSLQYGALAIELEKWETAEVALMEASRLKPQASIVMALLGRLWTYRTDQDQTQSLQTAKQWYLRSLECKRIAPALTLLGAVSVKLDQIPEAKAAFEEAIAIDPRYDEAMYNLAVLQRKTDPERCMELLSRAVEIDPDYALAHQLLGKVLQHQGHLTAAEQHFRKCLEIDRNDYWSNLFLANLLGVLRRNEEAERVYRHALELEPELADGFKFFAKFLESIGKTAEAATIHRQATQIAKQH